jgi:hypothetical protein
MIHFLKVKGWYIPLESFNEDNWSSRTKAIAYFLFVAALLVLFYILIAVR